MQNNNVMLNGAQGVPSVITKQNFFINNDPNGIADASAFLDVYQPMSEKSKRKYEYLWELLRNGNSINGMLEINRDKNDIDYVWVEIELPRGKAPFKVVLLSKQMFEFFVRYQRAETSVRFTLQQLVEEAERIEKSSPPAAPKVL